MVNHYRWDFIGLSTDSKPTADNPKVTDGSTFYESNTSKLYVWYNNQWYEKEGGGTEYEDFVGTDGTTAGTAGLVPAPATTDAGKYLKADGTWSEVSAGGRTITVLTKSDYNYPTTGTKTGIAWWMLPSGYYILGEDMSLAMKQNDSYLASTGDFLFVSGSASYDATLVRCLWGNGEYFISSVVNKNTGVGTSSSVITTDMVIDNLTSTQAKRPLSAKQGKALNDKFGGVSIVKISQTDYNNLASPDANTLYFIY